MNQRSDWVHFSYATAVWSVDVNTDWTDGLKTKGHPSACKAIPPFANRVQDDSICRIIAVNPTMQHQPPDNNNPANPLIKVAALELDREYISIKGEQRIKVKASLSFQQSKDMSGKTRTKDGRDVNVSFCLVIKRASLQLSCKDDLGNTPKGAITLSKVAFAAPLSAKSKTKDDRITKKSSDRGFNLLGRITGSGDVTGIEGKTSGTLTVQGGNTTSTSQKRQSVQRFETNNISATYAGSEVYWQINPSGMHVDDNNNEYLQGNAFVNRAGTAIDACIVRRKDGKSVANLEITGSVLIGMSDVVVSHIRFMDDDGIDVKNHEVNETVPETTSFRSIVESQKLIRERILKQIIRKHLINQGLKVEGALIEICKAFT